ncbi:MAG: long-chain fatty acid--CoA ligase [Candidatus Buchananbacteria bacterium]|nr:long-chain fatty acid--CoA ligase [Candidatus Buchananbacteria bacterium]
MQTIPQRFRETATRFSRRPALKFKYHGAYISIPFGELLHRVETLAKALLELGITKNEKVAILSENRTEWVRADLASLMIGAVTVPIHTTMSANIIKHILSDSQTEVIFVSNQQQFNKLQLVINDLPKLSTVIFFTLDDRPKDFSKKLLSLDEVMSLGEQSTQKLNIAIHPDDVASIIYTSGTTALPKGVMLSHENLMSNAVAATTAVPIDHHDVLLSFLPLSHVLERTAGYYAPLVCHGSCIAYAESIKTLTTNFKEVKPTIIVSVPRVFEKIHSGLWDKVKHSGGLTYNMFIWALKQEPGTVKYRIADLLVFRKIRARFGGRLRLVISGGATLNHKLARFFARLGIKILEGYGLTETSPVITVNRPDNVKFGTVGTQLPGVEVMIAPDKEILVRGAGLMKGYYNNEALTREVIDENGWFHTGDLGFMSSEGFLVIIGRKKEMISMSNGKIAWPEQIELMLDADRFIAQSFVYGNGRSYLTALIVPDWQEVNRNLEAIGLASKEPDSLVKEEKLIKIFADRLENINEQFADWEKIRKFQLLPAEFSQDKDELTPTLKLRRQVIVSKYHNLIERMYQ